MEDEGDLPPVAGHATASSAELRATWTEGRATSNPLFASTASSGQWSREGEEQAGGAEGGVEEGQEATWPGSSARWRRVPAAPAPSRASPTLHGPGGSSVARRPTEGADIGEETGSVRRWSHRSEPRPLTPSAEAGPYTASPHRTEPTSQWAPLHEGRATGMGSPTPRGLPSARSLGDGEAGGARSPSPQGPSRSLATAGGVDAATAEARVRMNAQVPISAAHANARPAVEGGPLLLDLDPGHAEFQVRLSL